MVITNAAATAARKMLKNGATMQTVIGFFKNGYTETEINAGLANLRVLAGAYRRRNINGNGHGSRVMPVEVTDEALAERKHRLALRPRDYTAQFCGDPLPGYSAGDRSASPSIVSDPLDSLVYGRSRSLFAD